MNETWESSRLSFKVTIIDDYIYTVLSQYGLVEIPFHGIILHFVEIVLSRYRLTRTDNGFIARYVGLIHILVAHFCLVFIFLNKFTLLLQMKYVAACLHAWNSVYCIVSI